MLNHSVGKFSTAQRWRGLFRLLRPRQWIKNTFVLAPLLFAGLFSQWDSVSRALLAFALFCVASSAIYIVNDWRDIERDRRHPTKRYGRPMAEGSVRKSMALALLFGLSGILLAGVWVVPMVMAVIGAYMALNLAYSFGLKDQPVLDIFIVASGFVLRVVAGAMALDVPVSSWMFVTTLCLALFLASVKRRQELARGGTESREVLSKYSLALVDRYAEMAGTGALVFYSLFVMSSHTELIVTIPLVLFGIFRYWYVVEQKGAGESPTDALLTDWQLMLTGVMWVAICAWRLTVTA